MTSPWSPGYGRQGHSTTEQMAPRPGSMGAGWVPWAPLARTRLGWWWDELRKGLGPFPICGTLSPAVPLPLAKYQQG